MRIEVSLDSSKDGEWLEKFRSGFINQKGAMGSTTATIFGKELVLRFGPNVEETWVDGGGKTAHYELISVRE